MTNPTQTYRSSLSTLFLWILTVLLLVDITKMLTVEDVPFHELDPFRNLTLIAIVALVSSIILVLTFKSRISPEGITSYSFWGTTLFIPWKDIAEAKMWSFFGLGYFRIRSEDGTCIYVARYLSRQREFEVIVTAITDQQNPLRLCIEGRTPEEKNLS